VPLPTVGQLLDTAAGRCSVPRDLSLITVRGEEAASGGAADAIWSLVEDVYRSGMHPAIQVCIRHRGEVIVDRAIGHARGNLPGRRFDRRLAVPLTLDTPVNLFSAAKAVTAMVIHKLDESGALSLDDRVADHVPGFERHGKGEITIRHVLTHRASIATLPEESFDLDLLVDHDRVEAMVCDLRPSGRPGGAPAYHAVTGGFVLESVARRATGRSLREILRTEIKEPLGLGWMDYGVASDQFELVAQNVETGLPPGFVIGSFMKRVLGASWGPVLRMSNDERFLTGVIPSANVIVTARDVATFYQCLLSGGTIGGTRIFHERTVANAVRAERDGMEIDRMLGVPMRYGTGFMLGSETVSLYGWNRPRAFGHVGMSNLFTWADPDQELVVALLTTGKPVIGGHLPALVRLMGGIYTSLPD
jgi:CubicO group peptidase (beta-lactamase class C family)